MTKYPELADLDSRFAALEALIDAQYEAVICASDLLTADPRMPAAQALEREARAALDAFIQSVITKTGKTPTDLALIARVVYFEHEGFSRLDELSDADTALLLGTMAAVDLTPRSYGCDDSAVRNAAIMRLDKINAKEGPSRLTAEETAAVRDVIDALGGTERVAVHFCITSDMVRTWERTGIPNGWHMRIFLACEHLGRDRVLAALGVAPLQAAA